MDLLFCSRCHSRVHMHALDCPRCLAALGFVPGLACTMAFRPAPGGNGPWQCLVPPPHASRPGLALRPCLNRWPHGVCNWMVDPDDGHALCCSCRLTVLIPDLSRPGNIQRWRAVEAAKRQVLCTLARMGLAHHGPRTPWPARPLSFRFVENLPGEPPVLTSHADGVITIDVAEADDHHRAWQRQGLGEPQRTLLGHLRHELGHYLHHRYVRHIEDLTLCREVFGDERQDYLDAMARHRAQGPPSHWRDRHISAYASAHPMEDWAETCAHLLATWEVVHTAMAWRLRFHDGALPIEAPHRLYLHWPPADQLFAAHWLPLATLLNDLCQALGLEAAYPFTVPLAVMEKLSTVQKILVRAAARD